MSKVIKLKEKQLNNIIKRVMVYEGKKQSKKEKDTKYDTWCKENGWEHGVGEGCADDALDSKETSIRSWGLGFLMGSKDKSLNEQKEDPYTGRIYDATTDEWIEKEPLGGSEGGIDYGDPRQVWEEYWGDTDRESAYWSDQIIDFIELFYELTPKEGNPTTWEEDA